MASCGTELLVFSDDMTEYRRSLLDSEVYRDILSAKLIGRHFIVQIDDDPKCRVKARVFEDKKWNILQWPSQSPDINLIEHVFHLLRTKLKAERPTNKQQLKSRVKAWKSITKEETESQVMSMRSRL